MYTFNRRDNNRVGFLGPFILGGITGGLLAPNFYPRPIQYPVPIQYGPYIPAPGYGPYYY